MDPRHSFMLPLPLPYLLCDQTREGGVGLANVTTQLEGSTYLHCRVNRLGGKTVRQYTTYLPHTMPYNIPHTYHMPCHTTYHAIPFTMPYHIPCHITYHAIPHTIPYLQHNYTVGWTGWGQYLQYHSYLIPKIYVQHTNTVGWTGSGTRP